MAPASEAVEAPIEAAAMGQARPGPWLGLSGRLILLTIAAVMLAEVLIYVPSIANFRRNWLNDRISGAQMVALLLDAAPAPPAARLSSEVEARLLSGVMARAIAVRGQGTQWLIATGEGPPKIDREIDLRDAAWHDLIRDAFLTLLRPAENAIRVVGPGMGDVEFVELILDERPLRRAMLTFSRNILVLSLIISLISAAVVYLALHLLIVRPVRRLTGNIAAFAQAPEDASRIIAPSERSDEIGIAERALAQMEGRLADELRQKRRLAELGLAVSKINHELRNMLTTAQLLSDRLVGLDDPTVLRIAPRLMRTLGRAIEFCEATLAYGRAQERQPKRRRFLLAPLAAELVEIASLAAPNHVRFDVAVPSGLEIDADEEQLSRILNNLIRNAVEALRVAGSTEGTPRVELSGQRDGRSVTITVSDNGPGMPAQGREHLFSAFRGSASAGGTGLGLPVADELVKLHGGTLVLEDPPVGTRFRITIPDRANPPAA